jgi:hypothetical protein
MGDYYLTQNVNTDFSRAYYQRALVCYESPLFSEYQIKKFFKNISKDRMNAEQRFILQKYED